MVKKGDRVKVHYKECFEEDYIFDSLSKGSILSFTVGKGEVIPGLDEIVVGMRYGEKKFVTMPHEKAYGHQKVELIKKISKSKFPVTSVEPTVGMKLYAFRIGDFATNCKIIEVNGDTITLDGNHPHAGKELAVKIQILDINGSQI